MRRVFILLIVDTHLIEDDSTSPEIVYLAIKIIADVKLTLKNEFINIYMKAALLCILVLTAAAAVEFETF